MRPRAGRTAVVVIAGVGDKPSGSASAALTSGLLRHGEEPAPLVEAGAAFDNPATMQVIASPEPRPDSS